jgi:flagellar protein FliS
MTAAGRSITQDYLATEVMTASPQKLRLMLIEAAIRQAQRAKQHWSQGRVEDATEAIIRCQLVVTELLAGVNREAPNGLAPKIVAVYMFLCRTLVEANLQRSEEKLDHVLEVLEVERETWRLVCHRQGASSAAGQALTTVPAPAKTALPAAPGFPAAGESARFSIRA